MEVKPGRPMPSDGGSAEPQATQIDLTEKGRGTDGQLLSLDRRLFMQFMSFRGEPVTAWQDVFAAQQPQAVLYQDIQDPLSVGIMVYCEQPAYLFDVMHPVLSADPLRKAVIRDEFTMLGRTYSLGYESNLEEVLIHRPIRRICDPANSWAVYYPLRRSGRFEQESREEQRRMLMEHGGIGQAFGKAGFATDIRLAAHGLNSADNDFIVGLLGKELHPLSAVVQRMRKTRQTAEFIEHMGPFFIGRACWQPPFDESVQVK